MPFLPAYIDPNGVETNRAPDGFAPGWMVNGVPPFLPPGTGKV
jgi:hypothetical protein